MSSFGVPPPVLYPADTATYDDDDVGEELPEDRTLRYQRLQQLWTARLRPHELEEVRKLYGVYEWGLEVGRIEAIRLALRDMEWDDRDALRRWCAVVSGKVNHA